MTYVYTKLANCQAETKCNVYGIVEEIRKPIQRSSNGKFTCIIGIVDETQLKPFGVSIFCLDKTQEIPEITLGSIIRLHRMQVERFKDSFDGRVFSSKDVLVFPRKHFPNIQWISNAKKVTMKESDNERVKQLQACVQAREDVRIISEDSFEMTDFFPPRKELTIAENPLTPLNGDFPGHSGSIHAVMITDDCDEIENGPCTTITLDNDQSDGQCNPTVVSEEVVNQDAGKDVADILEVAQGDSLDIAVADGLWHSTVDYPEYYDEDTVETWHEERRLYEEVVRQIAGKDTANILEVAKDDPLDSAVADKQCHSTVDYPEYYDDDTVETWDEERRLCYEILGQNEESEVDDLDFANSFHAGRGISAVTPDPQPTEEFKVLDKDGLTLPEYRWKFLDTEPSLSELQEGASKDLLQWNCMSCSKAFPSSAMDYKFDERESRLYTKCHNCGSEGMAIPEFQFYALYEEEPDVTHKVLVTGEDACRYLGTSFKAYAFQKGVSETVHKALANMRDQEPKPLRLCPYYVNGSKSYRYISSDLGNFL